MLNSLFLITIFAAKAEINPQTNLPVVITDKYVQQKQLSSKAAAEEFAKRFGRQRYRESKGWSIETSVVPIAPIDAVKSHPTRLLEKRSVEKFLDMNLIQIKSNPVWLNAQEFPEEQRGEIETEFILSIIQSVKNVIAQNCPATPSERKQYWERVTGYINQYLEVDRALKIAQS